MRQAALPISQAAEACGTVAKNILIGEAARQPGLPAGYSPALERVETRE